MEYRPFQNSIALKEAVPRAAHRHFLPRGRLVLAVAVLYQFVGHHSILDFVHNIPRSDNLMAHFGRPLAVDVVYKLLGHGQTEPQPSQFHNRVGRQHDVAGVRSSS